MSREAYVLKLTYKDDFDRLKRLVELFSYRWKMEGKVSTVLRSKLIILLSLYLKNGFNKETKEMASKVLGVNMASINSMNLELRNGSYLSKDKMNTRINHLHPDLTLLKDYSENLVAKDTAPLVVFQMVLSKNEGT